MKNSTQDYFESFKEVSIIKEQAPVTNLDYSINGEMLAYTINGMLKIHSSTTIALKNIITVNIQNMKYFQNNTLLHSTDNIIYYLSTYDNKHLRKFGSHLKNVESISVDSVNDLFMSTASDCVNIWDIRMEEPIKKINVHNHIGALGSENQYSISDNNFIKIFDIRSDNGPVLTKTILPSFYKKMYYTRNNKYIALVGNGVTRVYTKEGELQNFVNLEVMNDGEITSNSETLLCGSNNYIYAYRIADRSKVGAMSTKGVSNLMIRTNPSNQQFASVSDGFIKLHNPMKKEPDTNMYNCFF